MPKAPAPVTVQNDFTSVEQRQAALRARGLVPASSKVPAQFRDADGFMMSLSEQEAEIDRRRAVVIPGRLSTEDNGESEARKIREAWLVKQTGAGSSSTTVIAEEVPRRTSDAMERASKDGLVGERNPVRATFVQAKALSPKLGEIGKGSPPESPLVTLEDFHTAPNTPPGWDNERRHSVDPSRPVSPLRNSNSLSGSPSKDSSKSPTSRRPSTDLLTPRRGSTSTATSDPVLSESPRASLAVLEEEVPTPVAVSPAGTMRARKEKPPPIVVTSHRPSQDAKAQHSIAVAMAAPDLEASISDRPSLEQRGRPTGNVNVNALSPPLAQDLSSSSSGSSHSGVRSRTTTIPALSPTRTVSSSGASSSLPTPTTTSCARDASISRGSTSHSSDNGHETASRPRRGNVELKAKGPSGAGAVIMEEYSETEPSSEGGEFGVLAPVNLSQPQGQAQPQSRTRSQAQETAAPSRTPRIQVADDSAAVKQNNRKSFSLFGKKSLDVSTLILFLFSLGLDLEACNVLTVPCLTLPRFPGRHGRHRPCQTCDARSRRRSRGRSWPSTPKLRTRGMDRTSAGSALRCSTRRICLRRRRSRRLRTRTRTSTRWGTRRGTRRAWGPGRRGKRLLPLYTVVGVYSCRHIR